MKILVTGASRGIGRSICELLSQRGHEIIGTCRRPQALANPLPGVAFIALDLSDPQSVRDCMAAVGDVDVLVNNAGISQFGPVDSIDDAAIRRIFEVNFFGAVALSRFFLGPMLARRTGKIINIGSLMGHFSLPYYSTYAATKHALKAHTLSLRQEVRHFGIDVHMVDPYDTDTAIEREFICLESSSNYLQAKDMLQGIERRVSAGVSPEIIAIQVVRIIESRHSAFALPVGGPAPLLLFLRRLVSQRMEEWLIRKMYKL